MAGRFQLIQYDGRGQGMSSRGLTDSHSLSDHLRDLAAVMSRQSAKRFVLIAGSWSAHAAIRFAIERPQVLDGLVLQACPASGSAWPTSMFVDLAARDWDAFVRNIAAQGQPDAVPASINRLKQSTTQQDYLANFRAFVASDISDLLPRLSAPTLITHPRDFIALAPEESMKVASKITGARLAFVDGATCPGEAQQELKATEEFIASLAERDSSRGQALSSGDSTGLSAREAEVLHLLAAGKSNQQIADELVISLNTVRRHVSNIFAKTGAANRAEAVSYAHRNGLA